jgi:prepilin peptidase CpaA
MLTHLLQISSIAVAAVALGSAALHDLRRYEIPDRFAVAIALSFIASSLTTPLHQALAGLAVGMVVLVVGVVFFARRWLGGGDVKLLAAIALWVPIPQLAGFALATSLAGAGLGMLMMSPARQYLPAAPMGLSAASRLRQPMPFGVAIAIGGLIALYVRLAG